MIVSTRRAAFGAGILVLAMGGANPAVAKAPGSAGTGPSTTVTPYVLPAARGVRVTSLFTVDDQPAGNGVGMVGNPDGLGLRVKGARRVVALMNHEWAFELGEEHAHGERGAFVSRHVINPNTGRVRKTTDLIRTVRYWDYAGGTWASAPTDGSTAEFNRFCSGYLTTPGQLFHRASRTGYRGRLYFGNEENGDTGRDFAVTMRGLARQVPRMGLYSYENTLIASGTGRTTVAIGTEDGVAGDNGQLRIYVGRKQAHGNAVERAGLANGTLHVLDAADQSISTDTAWRAAYSTRGAHPAIAQEVDWNRSGPDQNAEAAQRGLSLNRIEDGAFDPSHPNDFYFLTTEGGAKTPDPAEPTNTRDGGGLWRLRFNDVRDPSKGMMLTLLLDGSEAPYLNKPDNMGIDEHGHLMIQEDPGVNSHLARIVAYRIKDGARGVVAQFDPERFLAAAGSPEFLTEDEESSGIIAVEEGFGRRTFLFDAQAHTADRLSDPVRQVQHGQLLLLRVKSWARVFGAQR
jgi:hypothetical protein